MTTTDARCPECGALVRSELQWCGLCHADLRPARVAEPVAPVAVTPVPEPAPAAPFDPLVDPFPETLMIPAATAGPPAHQPVAPAIDHPAAPVAPVAPTSRGKHARPVVEETAEGAEAPAAAGLDAEAELTAAFAVLRAESRDPWLAKLQSSMSSPGSRIAVIIGGAVGLTLALFLLFAVVGTVAG